MQPGFWRKCRLCARWLRRAVLVAILAAICVVIWFDRVGLPGFVTHRLVASLHDHGVDLEFTRMRLSISRGLVAENVHVGQAQGPLSPSVSARQVALEIDYRAAWHRRLQLDGLLIRNGTFILPLSETNAISLTNIQTDLELETNDVWTLNNFKASFGGLQLGMSGQVAHGSALSQWEIFHGQNTGHAGAARKQLQKFSDTFSKIHFTGPTLLSLNVQGDALDIHSFEVGLLVTAPSVQTTWGDARQLQFNCRLTAPADAATNLDASLGVWTNAFPYRLKWTIRLADLNSPKLEAQDVSAAGFWKAPALAVSLSAVLGNGQLNAKTRLDVITRSYQGDLNGALDPENLRPFLPPDQATHIFQQFTNAEPVYLSAAVSGQLDSLESFCATGHLACTNFAVHEQHMDTATGDFSYTNRLLSFYDCRMWRGPENMTADRVTLDFNKKLIFIDHGFSTADPQAIAIVIGPKTAEIMSPYHFFQPPTALISGCAPLGDPNGRQDGDLRFEVIRGAPFETHKFRATNLTGTVHWLGQRLILTNVVAQLYGGSGAGGADFDFRVPHPGADYNSRIIFTNVDLHGLMSDLTTPTNHLQGLFSGKVIITHASTEDWRTVDGYGQASLRDGLLWDFKIFGFFSTALNQVSPGLGNIRATDAGGTFTMTNGVIYSDTLQINAAASRLQYLGTVDMKENVNAHVTAQLLRNIWGVGPVISAVTSPFTKLFEYKVTGNLDDPHYEPLYVVPKLLLMPLHPIKSLTGMFAGGDTSTNASIWPTNTVTWSTNTPAWSTNVLAGSTNMPAGK